MDKYYPNEEVEIVMDEGRKKKNTIEQFILPEGFITEIKYMSSKEFELLQIADFFAYSVNRIQMAVTKENKTEFDKTVYEYLTSALANQFSIGTAIIEADLDTFTKDDYDYHQLTQRQIDGNLESWLKSQKK